MSKVDNPACLSSNIETLFFEEDDCPENRKREMDHVINELMQQKVEFGCTYQQVKKNIQLINNLPELKNEIPSFNTVRKRCVYRYSWDYFIICQRCNEYVFNGVCHLCEKLTKRNSSNYIIKIPLSQQIKYTLKKYSKEIIEFLGLPFEKSEFICDIHCGTILENVQLLNKNSQVLSLTMNVDGGRAFNKSNKSFWPIQFYQNFLPPNLRYKTENILISTLYCDEKKPNMMKLCSPLAFEMR